MKVKFVQIVTTSYGYSGVAGIGNNFVVLYGLDRQGRIWERRNGSWNLLNSPEEPDSD